MQRYPDLSELCEAVHDEATFLAFLEGLMTDFQRSQSIESENPSSPYSSAALGWENTKIDHFLDAATRWAVDSHFESENPWRRVADIIYAGKIYE